MSEIENLKERVGDLEKHYIKYSVAVATKLYRLEKTINWLSFATSLSFVLSFLLIAHIGIYER